MDSKQIKTIVVEKLFGIYDYVLSIPQSSNDNVFILYGDNGTGKSTILRLVYHLLSSEPGHAHKSKVANIAFRYIDVIFDDDTHVKAVRESDCDDLLGDYTLIYQNDSEELKCIASSEWNEESHKYRVSFLRTELENRKNYHQIMMRLRDLNVFYISDKRNDDSRALIDSIHVRRAISPEDPVEREMNLLHEWIVSQALEASKKGEEGTTGIYIKILSKLGKKQQKEDQMESLDLIQDKIEKLNKKTQLYVNMGFISETDYADVNAMLKKVQPNNQEVAARIVMPYIEIQNNRLRALDSLVDTLSFLLKSLNDYLYKKKVIYSVSEGFKIFQDNNQNENLIQSKQIPKEELDMRMLSSGERQLLSLFSMVIRNSNTYPIIIIDEPEISLNIKWQRRLLSTLNYFVRDTKAQFVIATHSFEILASHTQNTVRLGDTIQSEDYV